MSSNKRGRGRPRGTGLDDSATLKKMADMIVANPALRPTTAIKRALERPNPATIRRLQGKWTAMSAEYLADAQARRAVKPAPVRRAAAPYSLRTGRQIAEAQRKMYDALGVNSGIRAAHEMLNSPAMQAAREAARHYQESPAMRAIEEMRNSPTMRAIEEFENSPTMRAIRQLEDSPGMRAIREAEATMRLLDGY